MSDQSDSFRDDCYLLFDKGWHYEVARRLGISERNVRRWANGERPIPQTVLGIVEFWKGQRHE